MNKNDHSQEVTRLEQLLAEERWVRSLALHLLEDEHLAEDIVQQTFVAWLRRPPDDPARTRPWLRQVVRNFVKLSFRGSTLLPTH